MFILYIRILHPGAQSDSEIPTQTQTPSGAVPNDVCDRGYTSDSELYSNQNHTPTKQPPRPLASHQHPEDTQHQTHAQDSWTFVRH